MTFDHELDSAARANLSDKGQRAYEAYKRRLVADGVTGDELEQILRDFIWDEAGSESREENPECDHE